MLPLSPEGDAIVSQGPIHTPHVREERQSGAEFHIEKQILMVVLKPGFTDPECTTTSPSCVKQTHYCNGGMKSFTARVSTYLQFI